MGLYTATLAMETGRRGPVKRRKATVAAGIAPPPRVDGRVPGRYDSPFREKSAPESRPDARSMNPAFRLHCLERDSTNLGFLKYRDYQGFLVTGQHSGTHWIKWMLSLAIAEAYGVPPPRYYNNASSNDLIGHPKHPRPHPTAPRIASTHTIPPTALDWKWVRALLPVPPYAVVVRDIRDVLISNYEKWIGVRYHVPFSEYLKGDISQKKYVCDVWWYVHFMNRWGRVAELYPEETLVLRYEDFRADPRANLERLARHFGLDLPAAALDKGVAGGTKEAMLAHHDPSVKERPVRLEGHGEARFTEADTALLKDILRENLKYDFGYDFGL
jgi:hypothetical protein